MEFPISYSLPDGTQVEVSMMEDGKNFTFHLDKPTGHTDSFNWAPHPGAGEQGANEDPQQAEAIDLFLKLQKENGE